MGQFELEGGVIATGPALSTSQAIADKHFWCPMCRYGPGAAITCCQISAVAHLGGLAILQSTLATKSAFGGSQAMQSQYSCWFQRVDEVDQ